MNTVNIIGLIWFSSVASVNRHLMNWYSIF